MIIFFPSFNKHITFENEKFVVDGHTPKKKKEYFFSETYHFFFVSKNTISVILMEK